MTLDQLRMDLDELLADIEPQKRQQIIDEIVKQVRKRAVFRRAIRRGLGKVEATIPSSEETPF